MGQITISVHDQKYTLACRDGEEERLKALADYVSGKAKSLAASLGQVGDTRLLLMSALLIADELAECRDGVLIPPDEEKALSLLYHAASEIEGIAATLESA